MSRREAMSSIDTAWLRMDRPANRMMIIGVLSCERRVSCDRLREAIASRFLRHHRFRQRVVMDGDAASLRENEDVKEFYLGVAEGKRKSFREGKHYKRRKRWLA
jgi:hypothetical protein